MAIGREELVVRAERLLRAELERGPQLASVVTERLLANDVTETTLRRAKLRMGVISRKQRGPDGSWSWELPQSE